MPIKSYHNELTVSEISVGIERLLAAPYPTSWSPARIDLSSLPSGFVDLGSVVEDSPTFQISKEMFELFTGVTQVMVYRSPTKVTGELSATLRTNHPTKVQYTIGRTLTSTSPYRQVFGTRKLEEYTLLGVADLINGTQIVHYVPRAQPIGDWMEEIRSNRESQVPAKFVMMGVISTFGSCLEYVLAERFYFTAISTDPCNA